MIEIKWARVHDYGSEPWRALDGDAGYDLRAIENTGINPYQVHRIRTGIAVEIPSGYYGRVIGRSGLSAEGMLVYPGTIDSGYRGEISVVMQNLSGKLQPIGHGDRIAQLIIAPLPETRMVQVANLNETDRGTNGFGSTGR